MLFAKIYSVQKAWCSGHIKLSPILASPCGTGGRDCGQGNGGHSFSSRRKHLS